MSLADFRARTMFGVLAGYLLLNYVFMLFRVPPGIPLGDLGLILCLATINIPVALRKMGKAVSIAPFLAWWCFGIARAIVDGAGYGEWALRDAAQVFESLWLIVAFVVAGKADDVETLFRWIKWLVVAYCIVALGAPFQDDIATISPSIPAPSSGAPVPLLTPYANIGTMLLWIAFYCLTADHKTRLMRAAALPVACILIGGVVIGFQARTSYLQLVALAALIAVFRPKSLGRSGLVLPVMFIVLGTITALDIKIPGRITDEVSFSFIFQHVAAIGGETVGSDEGVIAAASGVPQRLEWWTNIFEKLWADPVTFITGLGYGAPLTDFVYSTGAPVREPHNSFMSVIGRLGIVGAISWIWLQIELFKLWRQIFAYYRAVNHQVWMGRLMLMLAYAVLVLAEAIGEDALEKPFFIVPYYCFWGVILRLAASLTAVRKPALSAMAR